MIRADLLAGRSLWSCVISAGRPENVAHMQALIGETTWIVPPSQRVAYLRAGAAAVLEVPGREGAPGNLIQARNAALETAFADGLPCWQLDDDVRYARIAIATGRVKTLDVSLVPLILSHALQETGFSLAGVAPNTHRMNYDPRKPMTTIGFIAAACTLTLPSEPRFDERFPLKEDYDFSMQHVTRYGGVARCNNVLMQYTPRATSGGAVDYRTMDREFAAIGLLVRKWPGIFRAHPTRAAEVIMNTAQLIHRG